VTGVYKFGKGVEMRWQTMPNYLALKRQFSLLQAWLILPGRLFGDDIQFEVRWDCNDLQLPWPTGQHGSRPTGLCVHDRFPFW